MEEKKEEIWLGPRTKASTPTEYLKATWQYATKTFAYTTIADRHRMVSLGNDSQPNGVFKLVNGIPNSKLEIILE